MILSMVRPFPSAIPKLYVNLIMYLIDGLPLLQSLQLSHIHSQGYANLRCCWVLGCPVEMRPNREKEDPARGASVKATEDAYSKAFMELFPGDPVPNEVGVGCCAQ